MSEYDKIFEMHGTIATMAEGIRQLREDMASVPMNAAEIVRMKERVKTLEASVVKLQNEQKVIEAAQIFFRVVKWVLGFVVLLGAAWAGFRTFM